MSPTIVKPELPGTYVDFVGSQTVRPSVAISSVVAIPIIHDWGPLGTEEGAQLFTSFGAFEDVYQDGDTRGRDAVLSAFVGSGLEGEPAAGGVIVYRMATGDAAASTVQLNNATPAAALQLDALYPGTRGDRIAAVVEEAPNDATKDRLRILFDGVTVERYVYTPTDLADLALAVNAASKYVSATVLVDGVALTDTAAVGTPLAGGDDGDVLTATEWGQAFDALEFEPFSIFVPYDLTDAAIQATIASWVLTADEQMRPVVAVLGGPTGETFGNALTRAANLRTAEPDAAPHLVVLGAGDFHDDFLDKDVTTSQLAPRIAGLLAGRGEEKSITLAELAGLSLVGEPSIPTDQLADARDAGITAFRRTTSEDADLVVSQGVTLFNDTTDDARPHAIFSDPRQMRVMDLFRRRLKAWGDKNIAGKTTVVENTRVSVRDQGSKEIRSLLERGLVQPGGTAADAPFFRVLDVADPDDAVVFEFGWLLARTTNYLIGKGRIR